MDDASLAELMRRDSPDELWDIYDEAGNKTGRVQRRGDPLTGRDCHLCVHVWIQNPQGKYLLTRRAPEKSCAGLWECSGGSALTGEDSLTAALREAREETGLCLAPDGAEYVFRFSGAHYHCDVWRFVRDFQECDIVLQPGETCDFQLAEPDTIRRLVAAGQFLDFEDVERILSLSE